MKNEKLSEIMGALDEDIIGEAVEYKRTIPFVRKTTVAAAVSLSLVLIIGLSVVMMYRKEPPATISEAVSGEINSELRVISERDYRSVLTGTEYLTRLPAEIEETDDCDETGGTVTSTTSQNIKFYNLFVKVEPSAIGNRLSGFVLNDKHEESETFSIKGVSSEECVAVKMNGTYTVFATKEGMNKPSINKGYRLAGRIAEINADFFIIDDSEVCKDSKGGECFKIEITQNNLKKHFSGDNALEVGDLVVVLFDSPIRMNSDNTVVCALDICEAMINE